MTYRPLTTNDIRQEGDEQKWNMTSYKDQTPTYCYLSEVDKTKWNKARLIGFPILASDLITSSFRRPC